MPNVTIHKHVVPGIGETLELLTASGTNVVIVIYTTGQHEVFFRPAGSDAATTSVNLTEPEGVAFVGLHIGASIESSQHNSEEAQLGPWARCPAERRSTT